MEKEPQQIQVNIDPNIYFITMVNMMFNEEGFNFLITSGNQGRQFTATPKHAKRIQLLLKQQIEVYEKQFGEIKAHLPDSPIGEAKMSQDESKIGF